MSDTEEQSRWRWLQISLYGAAVFLTSAGALVIEIVAGRMIAPYVGMSLYTWTAIISVVLAGLSAGHWLGGLLSETGRDKALGRTALLLAGAAVTAAAPLPLVRVVSPWILSMEVTPVAAIVAISVSLFFLPSFFLGTISPILTRLALADRLSRPGPVIGGMFAAGALGSIIGTLAAGYLFISWVGTSGTLLAVAGLFTAMALIALLFARAGVAQTVLLISPAAFAAAGLLLWTNSMGAFAGPCLEESDYYCIRVEDTARQTGRPSRVMVLDHLAHGINDRDDPTRFHSPYLELLDLLVRARFAPEQDFTAFFIGGGANSLPRAWQESFRQARLHISEIDPAVTRVAREALWFEPSAQTRMDHRDSRLVLSGLPEEARYQVIFGDAFHDISVPQHLTTLEFAQLVRRRLETGGFYALTVVDAVQRPLFLYSVALTLAQVFPQIEVWAEIDQVLTGGRITYLVIAADQGSGFEEIRATRPEGPRWRRWPPADLARRIAAADVPLLTDDFAPVDRLIREVQALEP